VSLGAGVTSIGADAFSSCTLLDTVIFAAGSGISAQWNNIAFSTDDSNYSGDSLWTAYTTGSKPGTYTRSGTTWIQQP